jgi:hypothetical protein
MVFRQRCSRLLSTNLDNRVLVLEGGRAVAKKPTIVLEYKYPGQPWREYDRTQVQAWADTQYVRMTFDFPGAQYQKRLVK